MDSPEQTARGTKRTFSAEGIIGTGITLAMTGLLLLMLGWAQYMRQAQGVFVFLGLGALLVVGGLVTAATARGRK
ncbi:MAG TPA: hypothetical protein VF551_09285 [Chthoniobacterales bacterium]